MNVESVRPAVGRAAFHAPAPQLRRGAATVLQALLLCAIWLAAEALRSFMGWSVPAGLIGFAALALGLFSGAIPVRWLTHGTRWLLSDMLLFFIPPMLVVVNYGELVRSQGLQILAVIVLSTAGVMAVTALVVDAVYRLELRLAWRRHGRRYADRARSGREGV